MLIRWWVRTGALKELRDPPCCKFKGGQWGFEWTGSICVLLKQSPTALSSYYGPTNQCLAQSLPGAASNADVGFRRLKRFQKAIIASSSLNPIQKYTYAFVTELLQIVNCAPVTHCRTPLKPSGQKFLSSVREKKETTFTTQSYAIN